VFIIGRLIDSSNKQAILTGINNKIKPAHGWISFTQNKINVKELIFLLFVLDYGIFQPERRNMEYEDRLLVHASIDRLVNGPDDLDWQQEAQRIITYCKDQPETDLFQLDVNVRQSADGSVSGYTDEAGNVQVQGRSSEEYTLLLGAHRETIGLYHVTKLADGTLIIRRKPDAQEQRQRAYKYRLEYDPETLDPFFFGLEVERRLLYLILFSVFVTEVKTKYGEGPAIPVGYGIGSHNL
jgi:hypothetical protein